jgi:hypothetical protein
MYTSLLASFVTALPNVQNSCVNLRSRVYETQEPTNQPKLAVLWDVVIALMMGAASTSETSVNFYQTTRRNNPEDSQLHTHRRENLKSHPTKHGKPQSG